MSKSKIISQSLLHALGILLYVCGVVFIVFNIGQATQGTDGPLTMVPILLLLVFSVGVMAVLVFGRPVYLFMNGMKTEALQFLGYTLGWLLVILVIVFSSVMVYNIKYPYQQTETKRIIE